MIPPSTLAFTILLLVLGAEARVGTLRQTVLSHQSTEDTGLCKSDEQFGMCRGDFEAPSTGPTGFGCAKQSLTIVNGKSTMSSPCCGNDDKCTPISTFQHIGAPEGAETCGLGLNNMKECGFEVEGKECYMVVQNVLISGDLDPKSGSTGLIYTSIERDASDVAKWDLKNKYFIKYSPKNNENKRAKLCVAKGDGEDSSKPGGEGKLIGNVVGMTVVEVDEEREMEDTPEEREIESLTYTKGSGEFKPEFVGGEPLPCETNGQSGIGIGGSGVEAAILKIVQAQ